jgi:dolichol-phosphate mannosyltransferase
LGVPYLKIEGVSMKSHFEGNSEVNSRVGIILPTFCEAENISRLITEIENMPIEASILVIDDSSPDGTLEVVRNLQKKFSNILVLVRSRKGGLGSAITDGFRTYLSLKNVPDFVLTMDADYSHNPAYVPLLVSSMANCDLAIGSRYIRGGGTVGWPFSRKIISRSANVFARRILGLRLYDCTSGFRCYSTSFLKQTIDYLHSQTYDIQIETVKQAHTQGFRIAEIPILFVNRKRGKSKLSIFEIQNYVTYIFNSVIKRRK